MSNSPVNDPVIMNEQEEKLAIKLDLRAELNRLQTELKRQREESEQQRAMLERQLAEQREESRAMLERQLETSAGSAAPAMYQSHMEDLEREMAALRQIRAAEQKGYEEREAAMAAELEARKAKARKVEAERLKRIEEEDGVGEDEVEWACVSLTTTSSTSASTNPHDEHTESGKSVPMMNMQRMPIAASQRTLQSFHPVHRPGALGPNPPGPDVPIDPEPSPPVNGWDVETEATVRKWQKDIEKSSFIYGELLLNNDTYMQRVLVITLLLSVVGTLLSSINVALGALAIENSVMGFNVKWVVFAFNIVMAIASAIVLGGNGFMKIRNWDNNVKNLTKFVQRLDSEWFVFENYCGYLRKFFCDLALLYYHRFNGLF